MGNKRLTTWQKATALVPLALLSGAWTASLAITSSASASPKEHTTTLPDGTEVPDRALQAPASMSRPGSIAPGVPAGARDSIIDGASVDGIPAAALAAYQRAEQVINTADRSCNLSWQLIAAIGRVESDHGRYGGNVLGKDGKSRPGIFGIPLDGSDGTTKVSDTDGGQYDGDPIFDRAVGPMQFIPQTWSVVGVDGDGDGKRDPQDIDDAALATAVYLCSGDEDLSTTAGQKAAVYRYNHSDEYVDLVLSIMNAYLKGDYTAVPNGVATSTVIGPRSGTGSPAASGKHRTSGRRHTATSSGGSGRTSTRSSGSGSRSGGGSSPTPEVPKQQPAPDDATSTVKKTTDTVTGTVTDTTGTAGGTTTKTLTQAEAVAQCEAKGISPLDVAAMTACVNDLMN